MGKFYYIYVALLYQSTRIVSLPVTIQSKQFHLQPHDVSPSKVAPPQNVLMTVSIEPGSGSSAIPCIASIRVSNLMPLEAVTSSDKPISASFTEGLNSATGSISSVRVSFSDNKPDVLAPCHLSPKTSKNPITTSSLPVLENNPTITSILPYPEGFLSKDIDQVNVHPNIKALNNLLPPIKRVITNLDTPTKFSNNQPLQQIDNQVTDTFNQISPLNKQISQPPLIRNLNNYVDSTFVDSAKSQDRIQGNLGYISLVKGLDKDQLAIKSPKDIFPVSLSTSQVPSPVSTDLPKSTNFYCPLINYPLKTRTSSVSKHKEILPSVNNNTVSSLLPNLTLSRSSQSNKYIPFEAIPLAVSESPSISHLQSMDSTPMAQPYKNHLKSTQKLKDILKSSCYKNYKSSEPISSNDIVVPIPLTTQNLINTAEQTSVSRNLINNDRLLSTSMTAQDQFNVSTPPSLVNKDPSLGSKLLIPKGIGKNSLNIGQTEKRIMPPNVTVNPNDYSKSLNSLVPNNSGTATNLKINRNCYEHIPHRSEMSKNFGANHHIDQTKLNKDISFSEYKSYNSKTVPTLSPNYSKSGNSIPSSLPQITLPNKDALSNAHFIPTSDDFSNPAIFQTFNSVKQLKAGDVETNIEYNMGMFKKPEFFIDQHLNSIESKFVPDPLPLPVTYLEPFNLSPPLIKSPSFLPKPKVSDVSTRCSSTSLSNESLSTWIDATKPSSTATPCITSIIINIIPYTQETTSEIIIII